MPKAKTQRCSKCQAPLTKSNSHRRLGGKQYICKACRRQYANQRYEKKQEEKWAQARQDYDTNKGRVAPRAILAPDPRIPVGTAVELGLAGYADYIETAFKVAPPVRLVDGGFGCVGVLMRDPKTDTVQCHVCGKWWESLGRHLITHRLTAAAYREKYGLIRGFPLCSRALSATISADTKARTDRKWRQRGFRKGENGHICGKMREKPLAWYNARGLCPEQADQRYEMVIESSGKRIPSDGDIQRMDKGLYSLIRNRGGLNKWREARGFDTRQARAKHTNAHLLGALRKVGAEKGRAPVYQDFMGVVGRPGALTIAKRFGSWTRALHLAGLKAEPDRGQLPSKKAFMKEMMRRAR